MNIVKSIHTIISECINSDEFNVFKNINNQKNFLFSYSQVWDGINLIILDCLNDIPLDDFYYVTIEDNTITNMFMDDKYIPVPLKYITTCMLADSEYILDDILDREEFFKRIPMKKIDIQDDLIRVTIEGDKWSSLSIKNKLNNIFSYNNSYIYISEATHLSPFSINNISLHRSAIITSTYQQLQIYTPLEFFKI